MISDTVQGAQSGAGQEDDMNTYRVALVSDGITPSEFIALFRKVNPVTVCLDIEVEADSVLDAAAKARELWGEGMWVDDVQRVGAGVDEYIQDSRPGHVLNGVTPRRWHIPSHVLNGVTTPEYADGTP